MFTIKLIDKMVQHLPTKELKIKSKMFLSPLYFASNQDYKHRYYLYKYNQVGGAVKKIIYDGFEYKINEEVLEDGSWNIYLQNYYDPESPGCFQLTKSNGKSTTIVIENLSHNPECSKKSKKKFTGKHILEFLLAYVKTHKKRLGIERIVLTDNSRLLSNNCKETIWLATTNILTTGHTWYGQYGFLPYDSGMEKPDKTLITLYEKNIEIMNKTKMSDIDLNKILIDNGLKTIAKEISKRDYKNKLLKKVLNTMSRSNSCLLTYIYADVFKQLGLWSFKGGTFYLDI